MDWQRQRQKNLRLLATLSRSLPRSCALRLQVLRDLILPALSHLQVRRDLTLSALSRPPALCDLTLPALSHPPVLCNSTPREILQATNRSLFLKRTVTMRTRTTSKIGEASKGCTTLPISNGPTTLWKSPTTSSSGASRARRTTPTLPPLPLLRGMVSCYLCWNLLRPKKSSRESSRYVIGTMYGCIAYLFVARLTMGCSYATCAPWLTLNKNLAAS